MIKLKQFVICFNIFHRSVDSVEGENEKDRSALRLRLPLVNDLSEPYDNVKERSPTSVKDVILASSKSFLGKVLSPTKEKFSNRDKVIKNKIIIIMVRV